MSNENTNMSVEDIRKIVESSVCEYRKTMWVGDWEEDSKAFFQKEYDSRFQIWKRAAELGIPEGQWFVGGCHEHGIGGQRNIEEAIKWNRLAADSDFSLSQVELGSYFSNEEYVNPPNPAEAFKWFEKAAKNKDPEGELYAAYCYSNGDGVAENNEEAVKWFRAAADQGLAEAQYNLGCFYANGQGVAEDEKEAVRWYQKAAAQDYPAAQDELATCLLWGVGIAKNKAEALTLYRTAAEQGLAIAQYNLGDCYKYGWGVEVDEKEAVRWYQKAAAQDYPEAQYALATCLLNGIGIGENKAQAAKMYRAAADQENAEAQYKLGNCYSYGWGVAEDEKETVRWYQKSAAQNYPKAQYKLAECLLYGIGIEKNEAEAIKLYNAAADQENAEAQNKLGLCYYDGQGVDKDKSKAVFWFRKAAEQDNPDAQFNLAASYERGRGVEKNLATAIEWYRKAADQGIVTAQYRLALLFLEGKGVARDETEAIKWLQKASDQGYAWATRRLNMLRPGAPAVSESGPSAAQESPVPQEETPALTEEEIKSGQPDLPDADSESILVQCRCGVLSCLSQALPGSSCECPSCHSKITIPSGPIQNAYFVTDLFPDRKEVTPQIVFKSQEPAIVTIRTESGTGSGFFITSDGLIITNAHVVDDFETVTIKQLNGADIRGRVICSFHRVDLAFIKINTPRQLPFVRLGRSEQMSVGDAAFAIGSPHHLEGTFTEGIISAVDRKINGCHFIQTDATINHGNSGGPLLNIFTEVLGVNTWGRTDAANINFAVPVTVLRECIREVICGRFIEKKYCATCGHASADVNYCDNCGCSLGAKDKVVSEPNAENAQLEKKSTISGCPACGAKVSPDAIYCPRCGANISKGE